MQQISSCCNEIYVCNNLNILYTVYIYSLWPAIVYKKEEAVALCVTTLAHPYSLFISVLLFLFSFSCLAKKASEALYLGRNYFNPLTKIKRLEFFILVVYFYRDITKISATCQDRQARESSVKRLSKRQNIIARVGFNRGCFDHDHHVLNTRTRCLGPV